MSYTSRNPLIKLRLPRSWKEPSIISIPRRLIIGTIPIRPLAIPLLSNVYQHKKGRSQGKDNQALEKALVDIKLHIIVISVVMAFIVCIGAGAQHFVFFGSLSVQLGSVAGFFFLVVFDECCDPFLESPTGF